MKFGESGLPEDAEKWILNTFRSNASVVDDNNKFCGPTDECKISFIYGWELEEIISSGGYEFGDTYSDKVFCEINIYDLLERHFKLVGGENFLREFGYSEEPRDATQ